MQHKVGKTVASRQGRPMKSLNIKDPEAPASQRAARAVTEALPDAWSAC